MPVPEKTLKGVWANTDPSPVKRLFWTFISAATSGGRLG